VFYKNVIYTIILSILFSGCSTLKQDLSSNTKPILESKKSVFEYEQCKHSFQQAATVDDFNTFIEKYSSFKDAHQLIALAIRNRDAMIKNIKAEENRRKTEEERLAKANERKLQRHELQLEKETSDLEKLEQRSMQNFTKNIENFRKTLKIGVDTNCGQILETKGSSAKVLFSVKNYGNEHWIEFNKIFPKGHGCRFVKGKYIAPASF
jgi:hypothetical protein